MVTMDVYRAGQDLRGLKQSQGSIGRHAIIAKRQMHISDAVAPCPFNVGLGSINADDRLDASGAQRAKGRLALRRGPRINSSAQLKEVFYALRIKRMDADRSAADESVCLCRRVLREQMDASEEERDCHFMPVERFHFREREPPDKSAPDLLSSSCFFTDPADSTRPKFTANLEVLFTERTKTPDRSSPNQRNC